MKQENQKFPIPSSSILLILTVAVFVVLSVGVVLFYALPRALTHYTGLPLSVAMVSVLLFSLNYPFVARKGWGLPKGIRSLVAVLFLGVAAYWAVDTQHYWVLLCAVSPMVLGRLLARHLKKLAAEMAAERARVAIVTDGSNSL